jgi:hypothetical protein
MNWRRGYFRLWVCASGLWAAWVLLCRAPYFFAPVGGDDLFGEPWLPWWASLVSHVQPYADPTLWTRSGSFPLGTDLSPSNALVAARAGDILIEIFALPALLFLTALVSRWVVIGFLSGDRMNPLRWRREHQLAWFLICVIGGIVGLLSAWFQSPFYAISHASLSGEFANSTRVFFVWLPNVALYWPWPMFGAVISGLTFYVFQLLRISN